MIIDKKFVHLEANIMMRVYFNFKDDFPEKYVRRPDSLFAASYKPEWLEGEFVDRVVETIDKSPRYVEQTFKSPVLGVIAPTQLAGGSKALFMIKNYKNQRNYSSVCFGENCIPFIAELSHTCDFTLVMDHSLWEPELSKASKVDAELWDGTKFETMNDISIAYLLASSKHCK